MFKILNFNRNINFYFFSKILMNIALGIFLVLFNLYIINVGISEKFLGLFLAVGNLAMAAGSIPVGVLIDRFSKKKILIISGLLAGMTFLLESFVVDQVGLICLAILYGLSFSALMCISGPFLMQYGANEQRSALFSTAKAIGLASLTLGSILGGYLARINLVSQIYRTGLIFAGLFYIISVIPLFYIEEKEYVFGKKTKKKREMDQSWYMDLFKKENIMVYSFLILTFFLLGFTVILSPYVNLYFAKRLMINALYIGVLMSMIQIFSAIMAFSGSLLVKKFSLEKIIVVGFFIIAVAYALMIVWNLTLLHIVLIVLISGLMNLVNPLFQNYIFENIEPENHGTSSGFMNTSFNLGDSLSTYLGGILIGLNYYNLIFLIAGSVFIALAAILLISIKYNH